MSIPQISPLHQIIQDTRNENWPPLIALALFFPMKQNLHFFQQGEPFSSEAFAARYIGKSSRHLDEH